MKSLRHRVEVRGPESYFQVISGRCSLLHYFLIVTYSFGVEPDYDYLIELFSNDNYMSAIQTCAPHLFRYLIFMLILSKNKKKTAKYNLDNVTTTYENNLCEYEDAVVRFVKLLFLEFNFEKANEAINAIRGRAAPQPGEEASLKQRMTSSRATPRTVSERALNTLGGW